MNEVQKSIDNAIDELDRLRKILKKKKTPQVSTRGERSLIKATALTWFNNHRKQLEAAVDNKVIQEVDDLYMQILKACDHSTMRSKYDKLFKTTRGELSKVRGHSVISTASLIVETTDDPPKFDPLIGDAGMQDILTNRWIECSNCVISQAPLAATVMMGGLLEALLLARINKETNRSTVFCATSAPRERLTGKTLPLKEWTLRHFIDVAHELGWISQSTRDVGTVLRDYRNYIHPYKELSHGIRLLENDARLFWEITKNIAKQLIKS